jgi:hypothetical protein
VRRLFAHLPDQVADAVCDPRSPPHYDELGGRVALIARNACYVLADDGVLGVRGLPDGRDEVVSYRDRRTLLRAVIRAASVAIP